MAISFSSYEHAEEEEEEEDDYIDIEVSSSTAFLCYNISSPPQHTEFEFHMSLASLDKERSTSPADELFYKGKLLPLHLPPRLQMVEKLLDHKHQNSAASSTDDRTRTEPTSKENYSYSTPFTTTCSTPFESCSVSPSQSCLVSGELNPEEYLLECPKKKPWSKKLKLIRHSSLGLKLKASRAYLKSLFSKSGRADETSAEGADETSAEAARNGDEATISKAKECLNRYMKVTRKNPFGQIHRERHQVEDSLMAGKEKLMDEVGGADGHRRSFSGVIKRHPVIKSSTSSSSSFSCNPNGYYEFQFLKRSSSANSEIEKSIQGAIAHCKQSQQFSSRKTVKEDGFCLFSASRIAVRENQERPGHCRG
ncbi:probable membrane-associated kinase regulator 4 [Macadamia integrifolia]|uniref:probable membrane-associated kinase regulator 4 n=1 Tax=Macadamia integrifolia TaxID=60698 RepID=UPI001C4FDCA3|nr:probable membrane-associated kinase regulator 4 [Macadamia integrifolia]